MLITYTSVTSLQKLLEVCDLIVLITGAGWARAVATLLLCIDRLISKVCCMTFTYLIQRHLGRGYM